MLATQMSQHKTDTQNDLQQKQEDAFEKTSEQVKAQEDWQQKEMQYLEQQYSNLLAEVHARAEVWCCELLIFFFQCLRDDFSSLSPLAAEGNLGMLVYF